MKTENMTFSEALEAMKQGCKVRRKEWDNNEVAKDDYLYIDGGAFCDSKGDRFYSLKDFVILATDWEIYTEPKPEPQFEVGELVMMRDCNDDNWKPRHFAKIDIDGYYLPISGGFFKQCAKFDKDIVFTYKPAKQ